MHIIFDSLLRILCVCMMVASIQVFILMILLTIKITKELLKELWEDNKK